MEITSKQLKVSLERGFNFSETWRPPLQHEGVHDAHDPMIKRKSCPLPDFYDLLLPTPEVRDCNGLEQQEQRVNSGLLKKKAVTQISSCSVLVSVRPLVGRGAARA